MPETPEPQKEARRYKVEFTPEFEEWWDTLNALEQDSCQRMFGLLSIEGPWLGRPAADTLKGSKLANLKELRVQHAGKPYRMFYVFDPRRIAVLLLGAVKTDAHFYKRRIALAEQIYARHLVRLGRED